MTRELSLGLDGNKQAHCGEKEEKKLVFPLFPPVFQKTKARFRCLNAKHKRHPQWREIRID